MPRPQLTKTESLIYRGFIVAYLLLVALVIGGAVWSLIGDLHIERAMLDGLLGVTTK